MQKCEECGRNFDLGHGKMISPAICPDCFKKKIDEIDKETDDSLRPVDLRKIFVNI